MRFKQTLGSGIFVVLVLFACATVHWVGADSLARGVKAASSCGESVLDVAPPLAVKRAGGRELREFCTGRLIAAQTGCAACHRFGDSGNRGPGPALTRVGSRLTESEIRRALLYSKPPMPSYKGLSRDRLRVLARFLSFLR